jgi:hypothetical protein
MNPRAVLLCAAFASLSGCNGTAARLLHQDAGAFAAKRPRAASADGGSPSPLDASVAALGGLPDAGDTSSPTARALDASFDPEGLVDATVAAPGPTSNLDGGSGSPRQDASSLDGGGTSRQRDGGGGVADGATPRDAGPRGLFDVQVVRASDLDPDAPSTVGIVTFSTRGLTRESASVQFGPDAAYGQSAPVAAGSAGHRTLLLGNKPSSTVHLDVVVQAREGTFHSGDLSFQTGPAPEALIESFTVSNESARDRGFLLLSYWRGGSDWPVFILDADGDPVWWYAPAMVGVARAAFSYDADSLWLVSGSNAGRPIETVSLDTLTEVSLADTVASHDIVAVSPGLMAYLDYGDDGCDAVREIDVDGNTQKVFDLDDYLVRSGALSCHANSLRYYAPTDSYVVSSLEEDVFIVPRDGGTVLRASDFVPSGNLAWGGIQHGVELLGDSLLLFANDEGSAGGGFSSGGPSTVLEYLLDGGDEVWRYETELYTSNLGGVERLPNGNTLVTISNDGTIAEVTPSGEVVLQIQGLNAFGYSTWRTSLYGPSQEP